MPGAAIDVGYAIAISTAAPFAVAGPPPEPDRSFRLVETVARTDTARQAIRYGRIPGLVLPRVFGERLLAPAGEDWLRPSR
jgi:hypothetical protein